ncbi:MAG: RNA polymerase sigma factor [Planctomycetota bacterium]
MTDEPQTLLLLRRWHAGDRAALDDLLARDLPWITGEVRRRMGAELQARHDADDLVQQAMLAVLEGGPRFEIADRDHYRALMLRIVENTIRKQLRDGRRQKRSAAREQPLPSDSVLALDAGVTRPSAAADRNERRAWVHLAIELLPTQDREVLVLRQWDGLPFAAIGDQLGVAEDAARMRFERALSRLARTVQRLRAGQLQSLLH